MQVVNPVSEKNFAENFKQERKEYIKAMSNLVV
jgi:hypothetical protein